MHHPPPSLSPPKRGRVRYVLYRDLVLLFLIKEEILLTSPPGKSLVTHWPEPQLVTSPCQQRSIGTLGSMMVTIIRSCFLNSERRGVSPTRHCGERWSTGQPVIPAPSLTLFLVKTLSLSGPETDKKVSMGLQCAGHGSAWDTPGLTCLSIVTCSIPTGHTGYV